MSGFRPTRASPPAKRPAPASRVGQTHISDVSRSSAVSTSELQGLTPEDIEFLDAVINRASPSATTFLTVFKAYNDILNERGMDPQNEVTYYGKLLKLGTLKGMSWGDKWRMVKEQQGHGGDINKSEPSAGPSTRPAVRPFPPSVPPAARLIARRTDVDVLTFHSYQDDSESVAETEAQTETEIDEPQYHRTPQSILRPSPSASTSVATNSLGLRDDRASESPTPPVLRRQMLLPPARAFRPWDDASDATEEVRTSSTTPPSYGAAVRDSQAYRQAPSLIPRARVPVDRPTSTPAMPKVNLSPAQSRPRTKSMINEEDAWSKITMLRDEKEADRFREDRLVERCWEVWKSGFDWILTTNEQISEARDILILRTSMQRWRNQTASQLELYDRVSALANNRGLRAALATWKSRLKEKKQTEWRNDMRRKMTSVREKREAKLRKDAWAKWRQSYRSHLSEQHYAERLVLRLFRRWKTRFLAVDHLEVVGDQFLDAKENRAVERCWTFWRRAVELRNVERTVSESVGLRIMGNTMEVWKQHTHNHSIADAFHNHQLKKNIIGSWKSVQGRIRALENRAVKHLARQDDVLLRAVSRVWKARERGKLLERVKSVRIVKDAWTAWYQRLREHRQREDLALAFSMRSSAYTASSALQTWRQVHASHRNALAFADHYHSAQLGFKMLLTWRLRLRAKLKMMKQGRLAEKFFIYRRAWKVWSVKLEEKGRQKKLQELERRKVLKYYLVWAQRAARERLRKQAEIHFRRKVALRTMKFVLSVWTNRVIEFKLREIEVRQQNATTLITFAFKRWKGVCLRHVEELSLMQSYQDVKREENIRRMFYRWLSSSRSARHRRLTLERKEDEMRVAAVAATWTKWRERFVDEKLRPIEYNVILQTQRNTLFRAFGIWQSRTKSLPALKLHASHMKAKHWHIWRAAMPQALQHRKAREKDKRTLLSKTLETWLQAYRTKIALKAVARARYLRLPTSTPRPPKPAVAPLIAPVPTPLRSAFPRRAPRTESSVGDSVEAGPGRPTTVQPKPFGTRVGIASLLSSRPRSNTAKSVSRPSRANSEAREPSPTGTRSSHVPLRDSSPVRLKFPAQSRSRVTRDPSPVRSAPFDIPRERPTDTRSSRTAQSRPPSSVGGEMNRTRLWLELRDVQRKSRHNSERSRSRDPP